MNNNVESYELIKARDANELSSQEWCNLFFWHNWPGSSKVLIFQALISRYMKQVILSQFITFNSKNKYMF